MNAAANSMQVVRVDDQWRQTWDGFMQAYAYDGGLLQSWDWGEFQRKLDHRIFRLAVTNGEQIALLALVILHELPFEHTYLYCPRGPVLNPELADPVPILRLLAEHLGQLGHEHRSFMVRMEPPLLVGAESWFAAAGFRPAEHQLQPKCSLLVDLQPSLDQLLAAMKQKTRYNLNLAERKGVQVRVSQDPSDFESFWQLTKLTAERNGIHSHTKEHYKKMLEVLGPSGVLRLMLAEYQGRVVAANLVAFYGSTAVYLHGASSDLHRELMAPYLLQWYGMQAAQQQGFQRYDFGGVNGRTFQSEKWAGITRFKEGFSPETPPTEYIGGQEIILNPVRFAAYKFIKQIRG